MAEAETGKKGAGPRLKEKTIQAPRWLATQTVLAGKNREAHAKANRKQQEMRPSGPASPGAGLRIADGWRTDHRWHAQGFFCPRPGAHMMEIGRCYPRDDGKAMARWHSRLPLGRRWHSAHDLAARPRAPRRAPKPAAWPGPAGAARHLPDDLVIKEARHRASSEASLESAVAPPMEGDVAKLRHSTLDTAPNAPGWKMTAPNFLVKRVTGRIATLAWE